MPLPNLRGRPLKTDMRSVWHAIQYLATTGCQWTQLPKEFPPFTTVQYYFYQLRDGGIFDIINETLVNAARILDRRTPEPTAGIIDSQSVKTTESGGASGYDVGKKIKGRKRHIITDTQENMLAGLVHTANIQDRDGAVDVIADMQISYPTLSLLFADGGYAGDKLGAAMLRIDGPEIEIVRRSDQAKGFVVIARVKRIRLTGRRTHPRMAGTVPKASKRQGKNDSIIRSMDAHRFDQKNTTLRR